jgi:hypothetical protein
MAGVFQNIDPPHPLHRPASVYPPPLVRGVHTLAGWGVNILEVVRHSSVLYVCKYFVLCSLMATDASDTHVGGVQQKLVKGS